MYCTVVLYMPVTLGGDFTHMVYLQCFQMHMVCYMLPNLLRQMPSQLKCTAYYIALGYCWCGLYIFFQPGWILFTLLQMINILCLLWLNTKDTMCWLWLSSPSLHLLWSRYRCVWWPQHIQQPSLSFLFHKNYNNSSKNHFCLAVQGCGCIRMCRLLSCKPGWEGHLQIWFYYSSKHVLVVWKSSISFDYLKMISDAFISAQL